MKLLSIQGAAERIDCSRGHIYHLIEHGYLRRFDIGIKERGGRVKTRVAEADVDAYIKSIEVPLPAASAAV